VSFYLGACPVWPAAREPLSTIHLPDRTVPLLVIGGTADPITPYQWAARLATSLGPAVELLYRVVPPRAPAAAIWRPFRRQARGSR
jgi:pimeloyl-ACP methyl ester carboxylesterase